MLHLILDALMDFLWSCRRQDRITASLGRVDKSTALSAKQGIWNNISTAMIAFDVLPAEVLWIRPGPSSAEGPLVVPARWDSVTDMMWAAACVLGRAHAAVKIGCRVHMVYSRWFGWGSLCDCAERERVRRRRLKKQ